MKSMQLSVLPQADKVQLLIQVFYWSMVSVSFSSKRVTNVTHFIETRANVLQHFENSPVNDSAFLYQQLKPCEIQP